eukprot:CAMPEP_0204384160 /NCGR_PEP_ID=MMETSP0469-20131031/56645_1 /ASSEMBLY_ACC=CAM_ASM_000384 /TAXON_ID=2969 /ORGANISM="Oxyrrhis marina" /LENGTH=33 /DNA_ID= /DNA_START= /DNA_END= /DNA_ORIENTATION=
MLARSAFCSAACAQQVAMPRPWAVAFEFAAVRG